MLKFLQFIIERTTMLILEYYPILFFILVIFAMGAVMIIAGKILAKHKPYAEKNSAYECGFQAFEDARTKFDIKYYLITIMFILFDLEVAFLLPWALIMRSLGTQGLITILSFLTILTIGLVYAWKKGALEWE
jgi:NADH-quinone oxidoreductase subunit A